ncbi:hypothetical protein BU14_0522s0012 [Porphyra umbilicalis]|uniref:Uncharacterized protein n=1 Tax=Porphyra umbilicalis TaxID=2786 RepID=A0A1X6NSQ9_PORUM|nr:hypothetical protein BU14_0522s0012 [Porphyra umbilicalis]|eukprot:OSX71560.1 hypothetical protein BU14_0522s0012 [Porphyra umbilicalis]
MPSSIDGTAERYGHLWRQASAPAASFLAAFPRGTTPPGSWWGRLRTALPLPPHRARAAHATAGRAGAPDRRRPRAARHAAEVAPRAPPTSEAGRGAPDGAARPTPHRRRPARAAPRHPDPPAAARPSPPSPRRRRSTWAAALPRRAPTRRHTTPTGGRVSRRVSPRRAGTPRRRAPAASAPWGGPRRPPAVAPPPVGSGRRPLHARPSLPPPAVAGAARWWGTAPPRGAGGGPRPRVALHRPPARPPPDSWGRPRRRAGSGTVASSLGTRRTRPLLPVGGVRPRHARTDVRRHTVSSAAVALRGARGSAPTRVARAIGAPSPPLGGGDGPPRAVPRAPPRARAIVAGWAQPAAAAATAADGAHRCGGGPAVVAPNVTYTSPFWHTEYYAPYTLGKDTEGDYWRMPRLPDGDTTIAAFVGGDRSMETSVRVKVVPQYKSCASLGGRGSYGAP